MFVLNIESALIDFKVYDFLLFINNQIEKHARVGAVIFSETPWTIENEILTPTMKIRREQIEKQFGEDAERLAREGAEAGSILMHWADSARPKLA